MFSWSWCCCRDSDAAGNETRVQSAKRPVVGISDLDLRAEEIGGSELHTPRDSAAQRASSGDGQSVRDPRVPRMVEKEKLKSLVKEFAKAASLNGLAVKIANPKSGETVSSKFELDKYLMWFTLTPPPPGVRKTESGSYPDKVQFMLVSITSVVRGREVLDRVPHYPKHLAESTVLLDAEKPEDRLFFIINDSNERRKFYMSIKVISTGGAGYIGSHTVIHLINAGYKVTVLDNLCNASAEVISRLEEICGKKIPMVTLDLRNKDAIVELFKNQKFDGVIHYAALKAVGESVAKPLLYYENNLIGTLNLIEAMEKAGCKLLVFSSSATVYQPSEVPLKECDPLGASNPYGQTKVMLEQILRDVFVADKTWKISLLRYFNPVGAHQSGRIGESPETPMNLLPFIQQVAIGRRPCLNVFGSDWNTSDGTGVRDYIHVEDLAIGHIAALMKLKLSNEGICMVHNLGTGKGVSVLEMVKYFEEASGKKIPLNFAPRRPGDLSLVIADPSKAEKELGWKATRTIQEACISAWKWQAENPYGYDGPRN